MRHGRLRARGWGSLVVVATLALAGACSDGDGSDTASPPSTVTPTTSGAAATSTTGRGPTTTLTTVATTATTGGTVAPVTTAAPGSPDEVTIRATVSAVFTSARVLYFDPPVSGYSEAALTSDTEYRLADGSTGSLQDVTDGSVVEVTGEPGTSGSLIARLVKVVG
ncbi:MAG TPA: hypothetical protein VM942_01780 [Acidimicrobiales bacterium]|nr:hypothetical protein [Acidimicrobiales bacterium]